MKKWTLRLELDFLDNEDVEETVADCWCNRNLEAIAVQSGHMGPQGTTPYKVVLTGTFSDIWYFLVDLHMWDEKDIAAYLDNADIMVNSADEDESCCSDHFPQS